MELKGIFRVW